MPNASAASPKDQDESSADHTVLTPIPATDERPSDSSSSAEEKSAPEEQPDKLADEPTAGSAGETLIAANGIDPSDSAPIAGPDNSTRSAAVDGQDARDDGRDQFGRTRPDR
ncbi:MAG: hypothetical protein AAF907_10950, partial [Planctomycetota bacterium]